jgi:16S rRNA processing protein RimM
VDAQPSWNDMVLVGRVGRPNGIRGQVAINTETDFAEDRFTPGAVFWTREGGEQLVVAAVRFQNGKPIVGFEGITSPEDAERLRGAELRVPEDALPPLEAGVYYHHQLEGCVVETVAGERLGVVTRVDGGVGGSLLVLDGPKGEVLIPLAVDICVDIDVAARSIRVAPPEGLIEVNEPAERKERPGRPKRSRRSAGSGRSEGSDGSDRSQGSEGSDRSEGSGS